MTGYLYGYLYMYAAAVLLCLSFVMFQNVQQERAIMSTQEQIDALTAQVGKISGEVTAAKDALLAQVVSLQDQLANAGVAEQVDLSGLQAAVQSLDDINPDPAAPADVPADTPVDAPVEDNPPF